MQLNNKALQMQIYHLDFFLLLLCLSLQTAALGGGRTIDFKIPVEG